MAAVPEVLSQTPELLTRFVKSCSPEFARSISKHGGLLRQQTEEADVFFARLRELICEAFFKEYPALDMDTVRIVSPDAKPFNKAPLSLGSLAMGFFVSPALFIAKHDVEVGAVRRLVVVRVSSDDAVNMVCEVYEFAKMIPILHHGDRQDRCESSQVDGRWF